MADQNDEVLANALLGNLQDMVTKSLPGRQIDNDAVLGKIKDLIDIALPGQILDNNKGSDAREEASGSRSEAEPKSEAAPTTSATNAGGNARAAEDSVDEVKLRHRQERDDLKHRHNREEEDLKHYQRQEMSEIKHRLGVDDSDDHDSDDHDDDDSDDDRRGPPKGRGWNRDDHPGRGRGKGKGRGR